MKKAEVWQRVLLRAEENEKAKMPDLMTKYEEGGKLAAIPFVAAYIEAAEDERKVLESIWKPPRQLVAISKQLGRLVDEKGMDKDEFVRSVLLVKHE